MGGISCPILFSFRVIKEGDSFHSYLIHIFIITTIIFPAKTKSVHMCACKCINILRGEGGVGH